MIDFVANKNLIKYTKDFDFSNIYFTKDFEIVEGRDDNTNRKALESGKTVMLYGIEKFRVKDKMHYKDSGLNQVLCKLAKKNNIKIGFSFSDVLNSEDKERAVILGRMVQNVYLCNKYKVDMVIGSFAKDVNDMRNDKDLIAFARLLGMRKICNEKIDTFFKENDIGIIMIK